MTALNAGILAVMTSWCKSFTDSYKSSDTWTIACKFVKVKPPTHWAGLDKVHFSTGHHGRKRDNSQQNKLMVHLR